LRSVEPRGSGFSRKEGANVRLGEGEKKNPYVGAKACRVGKRQHSMRCVLDKNGQNKKRKKEGRRSQRENTTKEVCQDLRH